MELRRPRLVGFILSVVLLAVLATALPASASSKRVLYASGHPLSPTELATFGGHTLVDTFDGTSNAEWATALARSDYDVLVVGEDAPGATLNPSVLSAIRTYVANGRLIVILSAHETETGFMNDLFAFNTTNEVVESGDALTATIQPGAVGTPFEGGPPSLKSSSDTVVLGSTPGKTIYADPEGTWVFHAPFGSGTVNYLAWDFCGNFNPDGNGCDGTTLSVEDDWYRVLDRALQIPGTCRGQNATITGTERDDVLTGTEGRDVIAAFGGDDQISGLGGNDLICGDAGDDNVSGGTGKDKLSGQQGKDLLRGQRGKDVLRGQAGKDKLRGGGGKDKLRGGKGKDVCNGGKKDDSAKNCEVEKSI
jgi:Ca2+-binding RTX toxin-like protein